MSPPTTRSRAMIRVDEAILPHDHRFERKGDFGLWTVTMVRGGCVRQVLGEKIFERVAPCVVIIPPNTPYTTSWKGQPGERWDSCWAFFNPPASWRSVLSALLAGGNVFHKDLDSPELLQHANQCFSDARASCRSMGKHRYTLAALAIHRLLLHLDESCSQHHAGPQLDGRVREILDHLEKHFAQATDVQSLAAMVHLSPSRLAHLFRKEIGLPLMQYIEHKRLDRASERLLGSNDAIETIANETGYDNAFHFSTRFRLRFGQPPSQYRKKPRLRP